MNTLDIFEKHRYVRIAYNPLCKYSVNIGLGFPEEYYPHNEESILDGTNFIGIKQLGYLRAYRDFYIDKIINKTTDNETKEFIYKLINDNTDILNWTYLDESYYKFDIDRILTNLSNRRIIRRTNKKNIILLASYFSNDNYYIENAAEFRRLYDYDYIFRNNITYRERNKFNKMLNSLNHSHITELFDDIDYYSYYKRHNFIYKDYGK